MSEVRTRLTLDQWGDITVQRTQDVQPILDQNAALRSERQKSDWGRHVATIPNVLLERWLNEEWAKGNTTLKPSGPEFNALIRRKLQDPDYRWLRTDK